MTNPAARVRGRYAVRIGEKPNAPSVSTIVGLMDKPGLSWGAAKETALFAIHHQDEWMGLDPAAAYERLRKHHRGVWDAKAERGTQVHDFAMVWSKGEDVLCPPDCAGYMDALAKFYAEHQPKWLAVERSVVYATPGREYGGTPDCIAVLADGRTVLIDWKTGQRYPIDTTAQLAAYRYADGFGVYDAFGTLVEIEPLPKIDAAAIVYLHDDGTFEFLEVPADKAAHDAFLGLRDAWAWRNEMTKWEKAHPAPETKEAAA